MNQQIAFLGSGFAAGVWWCLALYDLADGNKWRGVARFGLYFIFWIAPFLL